MELTRTHATVILATQVTLYKFYQIFYLHEDIGLSQLFEFLRFII